MKLFLQTHQQVDNTINHVEITYKSYLLANFSGVVCIGTSCGCLYSAVLQSTLNEPQCHTSPVQRQFWSVDDNIKLLCQSRTLAQKGKEMQRISSLKWFASLTFLPGYVNTITCKFEQWHTKYIASENYNMEKIGKNCLRKRTKLKPLPRTTKLFSIFPIQAIY